MTLSFDVNVTHPYKLVMYKVKSIISSNMKNNPSHGHTRQHKAHMKQMAKFSWNFVNDSFKTPICLLYAAPKIAAACMFLSFRLQKRHGANVALTEEGLMQTLVKNEITRHDIFAISKKIMGLYNIRSGAGRQMEDMRWLWGSIQALA